VNAKKTLVVGITCFIEVQLVEHTHTVETHLVLVQPILKYGSATPGIPKTHNNPKVFFGFEVVNHPPSDCNRNPPPLIITRDVGGMKGVTTVCTLLGSIFVMRVRTAGRKQLPRSLRRVRCQQQATPSAKILLPALPVVIQHPAFLFPNSHNTD
jgi:hypothetical protein